MGSKRTNHKFGCFGEVRQSNILIPSKIPFIRKRVFLNLTFFQKVGGPGSLAPPPARALLEIYKAGKREGNSWNKGSPNISSLISQS